MLKASSYHHRSPPHHPNNAHSDYKLSSKSKISSNHASQVNSISKRNQNSGTSIKSSSKSLVKSSSGTTISPPQSKAFIVNDHWETKFTETVICLRKQNQIAIFGGSDKGEFPFLGEISSSVQYQNGGPPLTAGSIVLEVQGQKVAGYTQKDVINWLSSCTQNGNPCVLKTVLPGEKLHVFFNYEMINGYLICH